MDLCSLTVKQGVRGNPELLNLRMVHCSYWFLYTIARVTCDL